MRTLLFVVDKQNLEKSDKCDFSGIVSGSDSYLQARFHFGMEWKSLTKVAVFTERKNVENVLITNDTCVIPASVLTRKSFKMQIIGQGKDKSRIKTNVITIFQDT